MDDIKVIKDSDNKRVKREIDSRLQNLLLEGHMATRKEAQYLIFSSPANRVPRPKLTRNEIPLLIRETGDSILADIL